MPKSPARASSVKSRSSRLVAQVRTVRAVTVHRIVERYARKRQRQFVANAVAEGGGERGFEHLEHVVLVHEGHFEVELGELRLAVAARVLVAVAARQLVVAIATAQHQELLEDLRRLRQGVEAARVQARRHHEVARALRGGAHQGRSLDLQEAAAVEGFAHRLRRVVAQRQVALHGGRTQVEVAVLQAQLLARLGVRAGLVADHERQRGAGAQHHELLAGHLDCSGGEFGVHHVGRAPAHGALHRDAVLQLETADRRGQGVLRFAADVEHHLGQPVAVAQVEERDAAVVAYASHPAVQGNLRARRRGIQLAAGRGALHLVHAAIYPGPAAAGRVDALSASAIRGNINNSGRRIGWIAGTLVDGVRSW